MRNISQNPYLKAIKTLVQQKNLNVAIDVSQSPGSNLQHIHQNPIFKMATVQFPVQSQDTKMTR